MPGPSELDADLIRVLAERLSKDGSDEVRLRSIIAPWSRSILEGAQRIQIRILRKRNGIASVDNHQLTVADRTSDRCGLLIFR